MIKPTVGRVVWFFNGTSPGPLPALIAAVLSDDRVNLAIFDHEGNSFGRTNVLLYQEGAGPAVDASWCEWMPYQKGQAAKTDTLEPRVAALEGAVFPPLSGPMTGDVAGALSSTTGDIPVSIGPSTGDPIQGQSTPGLPDHGIAG